MATEEMSYEVLERWGDAELRQYAPVMLAQTEVTGRFEWVGNIAFGRLAGYIFGRNRKRPEMAMSGDPSGETIAMTAPVLQEPGNEEIAMTAPVMQEGRGRSWTVTFVMPAEYSMDTLPEPVDQRVRLVEREGQLMMSLGYSGGWGRARYERHRTALEDIIERNRLIVTGPAVFARYDPPFTPWFRRRNEVLIPVERP